MHLPVGPEVGRLFSLAELNFARDFRSVNPDGAHSHQQVAISDVYL